MSALERELVVAAIKSSKHGLEIEVDNLRVAEREYTVIGCYSNLITLSENKNLIWETVINGPDFKFPDEDDNDTVFLSIIYLSQDGLYSIEMCAHGPGNFPEQFENLKYEILD